MDEQINDTQFPEYYFNVQGDPVRSKYIMRNLLNYNSSFIERSDRNQFALYVYSKSTQEKQVSLHVKFLRSYC